MTTGRVTTGDLIIMHGGKLYRDSVVSMEPVPILSRCCTVQLQSEQSYTWRTTADDEPQYAGGSCPQCQQDYDADEMQEQLRALEAAEERMESAADDLAERIHLLVNGTMVPNPVGVDPIDSTPEVYLHGARADHYMEV